MSETKYVGKRLIRTDSLAKVTGSAKYTGDVWMKRKDMLYAKAKFPPFGRAKIISIDTSKAEKLPGVVAVMTAKDLPGFNGYGGVIGRGARWQGMGGYCRYGVRECGPRGRDEL